MGVVENEARSLCYTSASPASTAYAAARPSGVLVSPCGKQPTPRRARAAELGGDFVGGSVIRINCGVLNCLRLGNDLGGDVGLSGPGDPCVFPLVASVFRSDEVLLVVVEPFSLDDVGRVPVEVDEAAVWSSVPLCERELSL